MFYILILPAYYSSNNGTVNLTALIESPSGHILHLVQGKLLDFVYLIFHSHFIFLLFLTSQYLQLSH